MTTHADPSTCVLNFHNFFANAAGEVTHPYSMISFNFVYLKAIKESVSFREQTSQLCERADLLALRAEYDVLLEEMNTSTTLDALGVLEYKVASIISKFPL